MANWWHGLALMSRPVPSLELPAQKTRFRRQLLRWFRRAGRELPWRKTRDPYAVLVSEFMLQQTQVASVLPYYTRWLEQFPSFEALAASPESEVLRAWEGLGYYTRARHLQATAKVVVKNFGGRLPAEATEISRLPGVGRYTAGAIATFAFDLPEPIVEANIARVLTRLTNWRRPIDLATGRKHLWQMAAALLPRNGAREFNSALMDLGALICLARNPRCPQCPVSSFCRAINPQQLPVKRKRPKLRHLRETHAFVREDDFVLLEQSQTRWRGLWILPRFEGTRKLRPFLQLEFPFTHHRITLEVVRLRSTSLPNEYRKWFRLSAIDKLPIPNPHRRALAQLLPAKRELDSSP
jgi:A/G-specific adenine glycosylase